MHQIIKQTHKEKVKMYKKLKKKALIDMLIECNNTLDSLKESGVLPIIKDCSTCSVEDKNKYCGSCHGCRDDGGYKNFQ